MAERKNLPAAIAVQSVAVLSEQRGSLVGRGLAAVQNIKYLALTKSNIAISAEEQFRIGQMYFQGHGVPQDYNEAVKWFRLAAEQGYDLAQGVLGAFYSIGEYVTQNHSEAVKWLLLAADQGQAEAQFFLGLSYRLAQGVTQDISEAAKWYRLAADQGHVEAQSNLGGMYLV